MRYRKIYSVIIKNYVDNHHEECKNLLSENDKRYRRLLLVKDLISGVTDGYAKQMCKELKGNWMK